VVDEVDDVARDVALRRARDPDGFVERDVDRLRLLARCADAITVEAHVVALGDLGSERRRYAIDRDPALGDQRVRLAARARSALAQVLVQSARRHEAYSRTLKAARSLMVASPVPAIIALPPALLPGCHAAAGSRSRCAADLDHRARALPPDRDPSYREGANHHLGDDSFVAAFGRAPDARDPESLRMHVHLAYVRALLGSRPATSPVLASRRAELLGYLDDYIAKGTTPVNTYVPWRSPVFIDREGNVCAVGYLIERSVGRGLAEDIAAAHRFAFLDDIHAAEPAVRAWVAGSGFTLEELASIQPAYSEPEALTWHMWELAAKPPRDGAYTFGGAKGSFERGHMQGPWTMTGENGAITGRGTLTRGRGQWTSYYPDGARRAAGAYVEDRADGPWTLYHPSGNVAAEGQFVRGTRTGRWTFYYDTPARTPIARGTFDRDGEVAKRWRHFAADGTLVATSWRETPAQWDGDQADIGGGRGYAIALAPDAQGGDARGAPRPPAALSDRARAGRRRERAHLRASPRRARHDL
jgi:hypothetical protein